MTQTPELLICHHPANMSSTGGKVADNHDRDHDQERPRKDQLGRQPIGSEESISAARSADSAPTETLAKCK